MYRINKEEYGTSPLHYAFSVIMCVSALFFVLALGSVGPKWFIGGLIPLIGAWYLDNVIRINLTGTGGTTMHCDRPNYPFKKGVTVVRVDK